MKAKILFYDLETSPNLAYVWGMYEQNVIEVVQERVILSMAWKWSGDAKVHQLSFNAKKYCDLALAKRLQELFTEADIIVAHNGDKFDRRTANARMLKHGLTPPADVKSVDTLKIARRQFMLNSNSLDSLAKMLGVGAKAPTGGFRLWLDCMRGVRTAMAKMARYNKVDVVILERVYAKLRPWHASHPAVTPGSSVCPKCGSADSQARGWMINKSGLYRKRQCHGCFGWFKGERKAA